MGSDVRLLFSFISESTVFFTTPQSHFGKWLYNPEKCPPDSGGDFFTLQTAFPIRKITFYPCKPPLQFGNRLSIPEICMPNLGADFTRRKGLFPTWEANFHFF